MLQVKSFKIIDSDDISTFLQSNRIAEGSSIFVSEGVICIPFDDGEPMNIEHKRLGLKEIINKLVLQLDPIENSQEILADLNAELKSNEARVNADFLDTPNNKAIEKELKEIREAIAQNESQIRNNAYEINRLNKNIQRYRGKLGDLG
jgi:hypothetical protein